MTRTVPFLDLGALHSSIRPELDRAIAEVVDASRFIAAPTAFEEAFAAAHGRRGAAGCNSGTDALVLALRGLGVGPGDEVVVPSMTFFATAEAVAQVGATPVIADVRSEDLLIDPESVERVRTASTRAVIPVHLYGNPVSAEHLRHWRDEGLLVIEDAAQAHLAELDDGSTVGTHADAACFSFFPGKNLGAFGDAGALVSDDEGLLDRARRTRDHGRATKYEHDEYGLSSRLDGLQAAVLSTKLPHLAAWTERRRAAAREYVAGLASVERGRPLAPLPGAVYHLFVVELDPSVDRQQLQDDLKRSGVATGIHYPVPLSRQGAMESLHAKTPVAEEAAQRILSLPIGPTITTEDVAHVVQSLTEALSS